ncbi:unnamed protein product [Amoebophrya sp. A120]|nr:unnamed protein product [Amoebophrya sp. A120]|eukprot:GSA120T00018878001.1
MAASSMMDDPVQTESREKLARTLYFLVRYARIRCNQHKLNSKDYIKWHRLSQLLERIETNLRSVCRFLWFGTCFLRLVALRKRIKSGDLLTSLEIGYRMIMLADDVLEDGVTLKSVVLGEQPAASSSTDIWGCQRGTSEQRLGSAVWFVAVAARIALIKRAGIGGLVSWAQLAADAFLATAQLHGSLVLDRPTPSSHLVVGGFSSLCAATRALQNNPTLKMDG